MFAQNLQSSQCCPNTAEKTLHKKINGAIMAQTTQSSICWKISIYKVILICLSENYTRKLIVQFWSIVHKQMLQCCLDLSRSTLHNESPVECQLISKKQPYKENNPCNVVLTMQVQHCIRILSSQCCPNTSETTLHKKITCAVLTLSAQSCFCRKMTYLMKKSYLVKNNYLHNDGPHSTVQSMLSKYI